MKIIGYTKLDFDNYDYDQICYYDDDEYYQAVVKIKQDLRLHNYVFGGNYHQYDYGVPVFDNGKVFLVSMRTWGNLMAETLNMNRNNLYSYVDFAWSNAQPNHPTPHSDNRIILLDDLIKCGIAKQKPKEVIEYRKQLEEEAKEKLKAARLEYEKLKTENPEEWAKREEKRKKRLEALKSLSKLGWQFEGNDDVQYEFTDDEKRMMETQNEKSNE